MSIEAIQAVLDRAEGTDAEWRLLMLLAMEANSEGLVAEVSIPGFAGRMGRSARGVAGVKTGLLESGQLVVVTESKDRKRGTYRLGLLGEVEQEPEEIEAPKRPEKVKAETWREFWIAGYPYFPKEIVVSGDESTDPIQMVAIDAVQLLQQKRKVDGKLVTPRELAIAAVALMAFNQNFEYEGKKGSDYGLGANLTQLVMRIRDRPSWDAAAHVRLVESAWRIRWWERSSGGRRPTPSVIWSAKSFEQVVQDAIAEKEKASKGEQTQRRRYTRSAGDE